MIDVGYLISPADDSWYTMHDAKTDQYSCDALQQSTGKLVEVEDPVTQEVYVLMPRREFQQLVYDDTDVTEAEMQAAAELSCAPLEISHPS